MTRPPFRIPLLCLLLLMGVLPPLRADGLDKTLTAILDAPALKGGITGAIVCRVSDGKVFYAHNADTRLLTASNGKLWTSAAALEMLGDEYVLKTDVRAPSNPDAAGVIAGSLFLRGGGDGLLSPDDLDALAATLARSGVTRISGNIVGDGTLFTDGPYGFGWEWDDLSDGEFPQISGLEVGEGDLGVHVAPGNAPGDPAVVTLEPPTDYVPVVIEAKTGAKEAADDCAATRPWDKNEFVVTGTLPLGQTLDVQIPVQNPPLLAATLLRQALIRHGIVVVGQPAAGPTPAGAVTLATHNSLPLSQYLARMNKPSDNLLAESLARLVGTECGAGGTFEAGRAVEMPFFHSLGVDTDAVTLVDGSGLGRRNFVTPRAFARLLIGMHREKDWRSYYDSLPIAGVDGTLKDRMTGTVAQNNVHAKTGTLSQVRALSGYFTGRSGRLYAFSLLMNNFPGKARPAGAVQDQFIEAAIPAL